MLVSVCHDLQRYEGSVYIHVLDMASNGFVQTLVIASAIFEKDCS